MIMINTQHHHTQHAFAAAAADRAGTVHVVAATLLVVNGLEDAFVSRFRSMRWLRSAFCGVLCLAGNGGRPARR